MPMGCLTGSRHGKLGKLSLLDVCKLIKNILHARRIDVFYESQSVADLIAAFEEVAYGHRPSPSPAVLSWRFASEASHLGWGKMQRNMRRRDVSRPILAECTKTKYLCRTPHTKIKLTGVRDTDIDRLQPRRTGFNAWPGHSGFSLVEIVPDDAAGRRVFWQISRFPSPCIPALLHSHLTSHSSAVKTSIDTTETLHDLRVGTMRHQVCVLVSPVSLPRFLTLDAGFPRRSIPLLRYYSLAVRCIIAVSTLGEALELCVRKGFQKYSFYREQHIQNLLHRRPRAKEQPPQPFPQVTTDYLANLCLGSDSPADTPANWKPFAACSSQSDARLAFVVSRSRSEKGFATHQRDHHAILFLRGRGGLVVRLLASHRGEPGSNPGVMDDAAGRPVFSGISSLPLPCIPALLHTRLAWPSSALKTSMLRAAQISSFTQFRLYSVAETGDPRENPLTSDIVRYDSHCEKHAVTRPDYTQRPNGVAVHLMWMCAFSDWLREALGTGLVSGWLLCTVKVPQLAGLPAGKYGGLPGSDQRTTFTHAAENDARGVRDKVGEDTDRRKEGLPDYRRSNRFSGSAEDTIERRLNTLPPARNEDELYTRINNTLSTIPQDIIPTHPVQQCVVQQGAPTDYGLRLYILTRNVITLCAGTTVAEWLACSPPTKAIRAQSPAGSLPDFRIWESSRTMPLVCAFISGISRFLRPCIPMLLHTAIHSKSESSSNRRLMKYDVGARYSRLLVMSLLAGVTWREALPPLCILLISA
ncbi:hypothetical protein PR048_022041 [Dryococelus australis]|uniref:Uncharacterized protein n=1 Tax=Dryococelus australis TaxID=614101 RepID=A0ABQ9GZZ1_9NEOP|nr:hypothetical protein PR048_022041 [Dryococelus australis]